MSLSPKLTLRQTQSLTMTPQLLQSIKLLQMNHVELRQFVEQEIERNPFLTGNAANEALESSLEAGPTPSTVSSDLSPQTDSTAIAEALDTSLENVFADDSGQSEALNPMLTSQWKSAGSGGGGSGQKRPEAGDGFDVDGFAAKGQDLAQYVDEQIVFAFRNPQLLHIARIIAEYLDTNGYLSADWSEDSRLEGMARHHLGKLIERMQQFDPPGVFARSLTECLSLQLQRNNRLDPAMHKFIDNLHLVAARDFEALTKICGVAKEDITEMFSELRTLNAKPGLEFESVSDPAIVPEVIVRQAHDGGWLVELNPDTLPRVLFDEQYFAHVKTSSEGDEEAEEFLNSCQQDAHWLTRSLDQRARTTLNVAKEIVKQQDGFLVDGVSKLRPLTLKNVADAIDMHESTISRVTTGRYILTPRGSFEMRFFFSTSLGGEDDQAHSAVAVRHRIEVLVNNEDVKNVLSDDAIVELLSKEGIQVARRTVAKYREALNIPSSVLRRREKRALAAARVST